MPQHTIVFALAPRSSERRSPTQHVVASADLQIGTFHFRSAVCASIPSKLPNEDGILGLAFGIRRHRLRRAAHSDKLFDVKPKTSSLSNWTPEQIAQGKRWVRAWQEAGPALERLRRQELRQLDSRQAIALLCGPADYRVAPRAPKPTSGLVEQQRFFIKARNNRD